VGPSRMSHLCSNCGKTCTPVPPTKLSDWEIDELRSRAALIFRSFPPIRGGNLRGRTHFGRRHHIRNLAREYGISDRTLYRYIQRAA